MRYSEPKKHISKHQQIINIWKYRQIKNTKRDFNNLKLMNITSNNTWIQKFDYTDTWTHISSNTNLIITFQLFQENNTPYTQQPTLKTHINYFSKWIKCSKNTNMRNNETSTCNTFIEHIMKNLNNPMML